MKSANCTITNQSKTRSQSFDI